MNKFGILATLQARSGKELDVEAFLQSARPLVSSEVHESWKAAAEKIEELLE